MVTVIWTPVEHLLYLSFVFILFIGGIGYFKIAKEKEDRNERIILSGFALYLTFLSFGYLFLFLARFYSKGIFNGYVFIGEFNENSTPAFELLGIGHIFGEMCFVLFILEKSKE